MAEKEVGLELDILSCPICLDVVNNPVTISCGHSYCMDCIITHWDDEDEKTNYSCLQCEMTFAPRPVLVKNNMLATLVEKLKKTGPKAACDVCNRRKVDVSRFCLVRLASYCDKHYQTACETSSHREVHLLDLQDPLHDAVRRLCPSGKHCTCHPCPLVQCEDHADTVLAKRKSGQDIQLTGQADEKININVLEPKMEVVSETADKPVELSQNCSTEQVLEIPSPFEAGISQLAPEQGNSSFPSVSSNLNIFLNVAEVAYQEKTQVPATESTVAEPLKTRTEFLKYSQVITLDPNTAHPRLLLSNGNSKVTVMTEDQICSHHLERFTNWCQVLSRESLIGRCYWEVEWRGRKVGVAVSSKAIPRVGGSAECGFGFNDNSWALDSGPNGCTFYYNNIGTELFRSVPSRVGVYLDHRAGVLDFYAITDTMTLLHRVRTNFPEDLHAGVRFIYHSPGSTAEFCKLGKI